MHCADMISRDVTDKIHQMAVHKNHEITAKTAKVAKEGSQIITFGKGGSKIALLW